MKEQLAGSIETTGKSMLLEVSDSKSKVVEVTVKAFSVKVAVAVEQSRDAVYVPKTPILQIVTGFEKLPKGQRFSLSLVPGVELQS